MDHLKTHRSHLTVNATPPHGFPAQVIVMDKEIGKRRPDKTFYLRIETDDGVEQVCLNGAVTPLDARNLARAMGYAPAHWMIAQEGTLNLF